jgi:hypothetical protein
MELANNYVLGFNCDLMLVSFVNDFDFKGQMESPATLFSCQLAFGRTWGFHK